jgi:hypothetical protein
MSRRGVFGAAAVLAALMALVGWWHYYPTSPLIARLGLPGPRADADRRCGRGFRYYHRIRVPSGDVVCQPWRAGFAGSGEVNVDPLTRRVKHAKRMFVLADSISWAAARDSIRHEMSSNGGRLIRCYGPQDRYPPIVSVEAWRFPGYTVRLSSYHWVEPWKAPKWPTWQLQLDGYSGHPPDCGQPPLPTAPPPF